MQSQELSAPARIAALAAPPVYCSQVVLFTNQVSPICYQLSSVYLLALSACCRVLAVAESSTRDLHGLGKVAESLDLKPHLLRYWESQFEEVEPVRRGNRRLYNDSDVELLRGLKRLLLEEGLTTRAVRALLEEKGTDHLCDLGKSSGVGSPAESVLAAPQAATFSVLGTTIELDIPEDLTLSETARAQLLSCYNQLAAIRDRLNRGPDQDELDPDNQAAS